MANPGPCDGWRRLRAHGRPVHFTRGTRLITAGTLSDHVLLIEAGVVKVALANDDGVDSVLNFLGAGELVGELGVLRKQPRSAHVIGLTSGRAVRVAGSVFLRLRREYPDVQALVDRAWDRQLDASDARQLAYSQDVTRRLALSLLRWAHHLGQRTERGLLVRGISQQDMAQAIGASPKSVEAALGVLRDIGFIETGWLRYVITDASALGRLPHGDV